MPSPVPMLPARKEALIATTQALAEIVARVVRSKPHEIHPATRTAFQALRIFVNEELDELHQALTAAERVLKPGGWLKSSYPSIRWKTDRRANFPSPSAARRLADRGIRPSRAGPATSFNILTKRPVTPDDAEISANLARAFGKAASRRADYGAAGHAAGALPAWPVLATAARRLIMRILPPRDWHVGVRGSPRLPDQDESTSRTERVLRLNAGTASSATPLLRCAPNGPS